MASPRFLFDHCMRKRQSARRPNGFCVWDGHRVQTMMLCELLSRVTHQWWWFNLPLGGIQLLSIGLMGEYIGRIFETKNRPLYSDPIGGRYTSIKTF